MLVRRSTVGYVWPWDPGWVWPWDILWPSRLEKVTTIPTPDLTPPAPITEAKLKSWTLEDIWEAIAREREAGIKDSGKAAGTPPAPATPFPWWLVICAALAAGAIGIRVAARRK